MTLINIADPENPFDKIVWDLLKDEGITKDDLELVDLDIGFSPVIPIEGSDPCEVISKTIGGLYIIDHPVFNYAVSELSLKIMRYRYLTNRRNPFY